MPTERQSHATEFADTLWDDEIPLQRIEATPLYLRSFAVNETGLKVVFTVEGRQEFCR